MKKIWENTDGCAEQCRYASALYLMSVMSQCYSIIIDRGISAPGHGKEVVDGLNAVDKRYIYQLMSTVQIPGSNRFDSQMKIHTGNQKYDVSLAEEFQHHLKNSTKTIVSLISVNTKTIHGKKMDRQIVFMFRIILMLNIKM